MFQNALALFPKGFPQYTAAQEAFRSSFQKLLTDDHLRMVLFPKAPLFDANKTAVKEFARKIKRDSISEEELIDSGVVTVYAPILPEEDVYLLASLYVLPASVSDSMAVSGHPEEYKETRPHIEDSRLCRLPPEKPVTFAYYSAMSAFGFASSMVMGVTREENGFQFHLQPSCTTAQNEELKTENVARFDGMQVYYPVTVEQDGVKKERTLAISGSVGLWVGASAWAMKHFVPAKTKRTGYACGPATEILAVIKSRPTH